MKYYETVDNPKDNLIYRTDGHSVECSGRENIGFFTSSFNVERFNKAIESGVFKEYDPIYQKKKLSRDFWHNAVLIIILLILAMGFIFV